MKRTTHCLHSVTVLWVSLAVLVMGGCDIYSNEGQKPQETQDQNTPQPEASAVPPKVDEPPPEFFSKAPPVQLPPPASAPQAAQPPANCPKPDVPKPEDRPMPKDPVLMPIERLHQSLERAQEIAEQNRQLAADFQKLADDIQSTIVVEEAGAPVHDPVQAAEENSEKNDIPDGMEAQNGETTPPNAPAIHDSAMDNAGKGDAVETEYEFMQNGIIPGDTVPAFAKPKSRDQIVQQLRYMADYYQKQSDAAQKMADQVKQWIDLSEPMVDRPFIISVSVMSNETMSLDLNPYNYDHTPALYRSDINADGSYEQDSNSKDSEHLEFSKEGKYLVAFKGTMRNLEITGEQCSYWPDDFDEWKEEYDTPQTCDASQQKWSNWHDLLLIDRVVQWGDIVWEDPYNMFRNNYSDVDVRHAVDKPFISPYYQSVPAYEEKGFDHLPDRKRLKKIIMAKHNQIKDERPFIFIVKVNDPSAGIPIKVHYSRYTNYDIDVGADGSYEYKNIHHDFTINVTHKGYYIIAIKGELPNFHLYDYDSLDDESDDLVEGLTDIAEYSHAVCFYGRLRFFNDDESFKRYIEQKSKDEKYDIDDCSNIPIPEKNYLVSVEQWGDIHWDHMRNMFQYNRRMVINAEDNPDLSDVTDMRNMFEEAFSFDRDLIHSWDLSNGKVTKDMFKGMCLFNESERDSDKDIFPDCIDGCPNNPKSTAIRADLCGCGNPVQKLGKFYCSCIDDNKNICGCNKDSTADSDNDDVPDCADVCPHNAGLKDFDDGTCLLNVNLADIPPTAVGSETKE